MNDAYNTFMQIFCRKFNESFPLQSFFNSKKRETEWYDAELKNLYRKKQLLYRKFIRKPTDSNKNNYHSVHNSYDRMIKTKTQMYIRFLLDKYKNNSRATWKLINQLIGKKK